METLPYMTLLAAHNIAAVICVAGPLYMARIVKERFQYEKKVIHDMDRLMEDVITTQPQICWVAWIVLMACGTCLKLRNTDGFEMCSLSTMNELYQLVQDSDRVVTF